MVGANSPAIAMVMRRMCGLVKHFRHLTCVLGPCALRAILCSFVIPPVEIEDGCCIIYVTRRSSKSELAGVMFLRILTHVAVEAACVRLIDTWLDMSQTIKANYSIKAAIWVLWHHEVVLLWRWYQYIINSRDVHCQKWVQDSLLAFKSASMVYPGVPEAQLYDHKVW